MSLFIFGIVTFLLTVYWTYDAVKQQRAKQAVWFAFFAGIILSSIIDTDGLYSYKKAFFKTDEISANKA